MLCQASSLSSGGQFGFREIRTEKLVFEKKSKHQLACQLPSWSGDIGYSPKSVPTVLPWWTGSSPGFRGEFPVRIRVTVPVNLDHVILNQFLVLAKLASPSFLDLFTFIWLVFRIAL